MRKLDATFGAPIPGAVIETTGSKHIRIILTNGKSVVASSTPRCPFALRKVLADVRRK